MNLVVGLRQVMNNHLHDIRSKWAVACKRRGEGPRWGNQSQHFPLTLLRTFFFYFPRGKGREAIKDKHGGGHGLLVKS